MLSEMTSKERVRHAMELKQPDRVPVFPVITHMHASRVIGRKIIEFELNPDLVYDALLAAWREYGFDGFEVPISRSKGWMEQFELVEKDKTKYWMDRKTGKYVSKLQEDDMPISMDNEPLIKDKADIEKIVVKKSEEYLENGQLDGLARVIKTVGEDAFIAGHCAGQTMNSLVYFRGAENALIDLIENKELVHAIMQRVTDGTIELGKALVETGVDCLYIGDAWSNAGIISPAQFEEFCVPQYRRVCDIFHKYGVKLYLHICGKTTPILDKMASTGVDAIEPLDPLGDVKLEDAKAKVGKKVCLKGGINTLTLLYGTEAQVKDEVISCIEKASKDGGFIFGTGDDIPRDAPIRNVKTMVEAVRQYGKY